MDEKNGKKVFIIGSSAVEYTLAKKMVGLDIVSEVFVAPGNDAMREFCTTVDIREDSTEELLEFALENAIDLTVASSELAIRSDIASVFQSNNQMIFAPTKESADICLSKSSGKKFMYKTRIPCPKFGIFDKQNLALDYVSKSDLPIVIKTDYHQGQKGVLLCNAHSIAKMFVDELFDSGEKKVVLEDYVFGHEFSFYVITDGYEVLPLGTVATYKHELEGEGGLLTPGMGAFSPDFKVSNQVENRILQQIIYPTLNNLEREQTPYVGILGVDLIINQNDDLYALEFNPFFKAPDCQVLLSLLNENIYELFMACTIGSFGDDYNKIDMSSAFATSCVLTAKKEHEVISGLEELDDDTQVAHFNTKKNKYLEYETSGGRTLAITRTANVLSKAVDDMYEEVSVIKFNGMKFRRDIGFN